jgi:hypothetical protein
MQPNQCSDHLTGGRRTGGDRREYAYACCLPERRSGMDRRSGKDRRQQMRITVLPVHTDETADAVANRI